MLASAAAPLRSHKCQTQRCGAILQAERCVRLRQRPAIRGRDTFRLFAVERTQQSAQWTHFYCTGLLCRRSELMWMISI